MKTTAKLHAIARRVFKQVHRPIRRFFFFFLCIWESYPTFRSSRIRTINQIEKCMLLWTIHRVYSRKLLSVSVCFISPVLSRHNTTWTKKNLYMCISWIITLIRSISRLNGLAVITNIYWLPLVKIIYLPTYCVIARSWVYRYIDFYD